MLDALEPATTTAVAAADAARDALVAAIIARHASWLKEITDKSENLRTLGGLVLTHALTLSWRLPYRLVLFLMRHLSELIPEPPVDLKCKVAAYQFGVHFDFTAALEPLLQSVSLAGEVQALGSRELEEALVRDPARGPHISHTCATQSAPLSGDTAWSLEGADVTPITLSPEHTVTAPGRTVVFRLSLSQPAQLRPGFSVTAFEREVRDRVSAPNARIEGRIDNHEVAVKLVAYVPGHEDEGGWPCIEAHVDVPLWATHGSTVTLRSVKVGKTGILHSLESDSRRDGVYCRWRFGELQRGCRHTRSPQ